MKIQRAYRTELDPNETQIRLFARNAGGARWAWNQALRVKKRYYEETGVTLTARSWWWHQDDGSEKGIMHSNSRGLNVLLTTWKAHPAKAWTHELSNCSFQSAIQDLDKAFKNFFAHRAGYPKPKGRRARRKFRLYGKGNDLIAEERRIKLPKIGWVRVKERGYLPVGVKIVSCTISQRAGRWFASLQVDEERADGRATGAPVGVDLGLTELACASDGRRWAGPKALAGKLRRLAHVQRKLARQKKGSGRREDTKRRIGRLHLEIANMRGNALHELTSELVGVDLPPEQRPRVVAIEDLRVRNMVGNHHLARHISDAAWAELRRQLTYKCEWWGVELVIVNPAYSSQTCSRCGHVAAESREGKRFRCIACGYQADADVNAAMVILQRGLSQLAGKAPESQNARGGHGKTSQRIAGRGPVKRESGTLPVAPGGTPGHSTRAEVKRCGAFAGQTCAS